MGWPVIYGGGPLDILQGARDLDQGPGHLVHFFEKLRLAQYFILSLFFNDSKGFLQMRDYLLQIVQHDLSWNGFPSLSAYKSASLTPRH